MADEIIIETTSAEVIEVGVPGPQGPAGAPGAGLSTLTTKGDTLYRGETVGERLPIGSTGQVLKVSAQGLPSWQNESGAVSSVAGRTGAVTLASADITDATASATADTLVKRAGDGSVAIETLLIANTGNNKSAELNAGNITGDRTLYTPDASGTISLEGHGTRHNATGSDPIYNEMVAITGSGNANVNGYYYLANDGGDVDYVKIGSRRRAKLVFSNSRWNIQYDGVTQYQSEVRNNSNKPWNSTTWTNLIGSEINPAPTVSEANVDSVLDAISRSVDFVSGLGSAATADLNAISDADLRIVGSTDATKKVALEVDTNVPSGQTVTLTAPSASGTLALAGAAPAAHAGSHAAAGSDPLFDQDLNTDSVVTFDSVTVNDNLAFNGEIGLFFGSQDGAINTRINLGLGTAATADIGTGEGDVAAGDHTHAASAITSGTLTHERGGLEADVSAYNGLVKISGGSTSAVTVTSAGEALLDDADAAAQRTTLGLGTAAVEAASAFAQASHTHELTALAATGATNGHVLTANGSNGATFAALPASGVTGAAASASDVLGVSGANITGVDANADRIVYWNNTANKLAYGTPADAGAAAASHTHAASDITSGTIDTARLASGTANSGTFLRGDQTWAAVSGVTTGSVDNAVLRADGTGGSTSQSSDINIEDATTSTANNVTISNQHSGQTNSSLVLTPKGTGAIIIGPKPDGTSTGGNARGTRAVDLQPTRDSAGRIASGTNSFCIGHSNLASGTRSFAGGTNCTASGESSFAFGDNSSSSGAYGGIAVGDGCSVTGFSSAALGFSNVTSGNYSFSCGFDNTASGANGSFACGQYAVANRSALFAYASGRFAADGDAQTIRYVLRGTTTTNAEVELLAASDNVRLTIASGRVMFMNVMIVGVANGGGTVATFQRQYAIKNIGGTTSEIYAPVTIGTDSAASTSIALSANDTNDAVKVAATGLAATTIRWVAYVSAVEVAHG